MLLLISRRALQRRLSDWSCLSAGAGGHRFIAMLSRALLVALVINSPEQCWAWTCATAVGSAVRQHHQQPFSAAAESATPVRARYATMMARGRGGYQQRAPVIDRTPINGAIPFENMRVMVDAGDGTDELLGIMSKDEALEAARERELDLVLIAGKSDPAVVKIVSYDKFRFAKEKKRKEQQKAAARGKSELKELKMSYKIGVHDYTVRKKSALKFLSAGDKVKFSMLFRGREVSASPPQGADPSARAHTHRVGVAPSGSVRKSSALSHTRALAISLNSLGRLTWPPAGHPLGRGQGDHDAHGRRAGGGWDP